MHCIIIIHPNSLYINMKIILPFKLIARNIGLTLSVHLFNQQNQKYKYNSRCYKSVKKYLVHMSLRSFAENFAGTSLYILKIASLWEKQSKTTQRHKSSIIHDNMLATCNIFIHSNCIINAQKSFQNPDDIWQ